MKRCTLFVILILTILLSDAQSPDSSLKVALNIPNKFICTVDKKIRLVNTQLHKMSLKYLSRFQKYDSKLRKKHNQLNNIDVSRLYVGANLFSDIKRKIKSNVGDTNKIITSEYNSYIDSIGTMFSYVNK